MRVRLTRRAEIDLEAIGAFLEAEAGRPTALRIVRRIRARIMQLKDNPQLGLETDWTAGRRRLLDQPYVILYRITSDNEVRVVRILHGARDIPTILADEPDGDGP